MVNFSGVGARARGRLVERISEQLASELHARVGTRSRKRGRMWRGLCGCELRCMKSEMALVMLIGHRWSHVDTCQTYWSAKDARPHSASMESKLS